MILAIWPINAGKNISQMIRSFTNSSKSKKIILSLIAIFGVGILCLSYAYFIEPQRLVLHSETVSVLHLDPAFDGLRIAMISDVHGGSNGVDDAKLRKVVEMANAADPDIIVLLGDYVSQTRDRDESGIRKLRMSVSDIANGLIGLQAKYGVYAVLGNHDGWYSNDLIAGELSRVGYTVLQNQIVTINVNGKPLRLLGLKDHLSLDNGWYETAPMARKLIEGSGTGDVIVLEHAPDTFKTISGKLSIGPDFKLYLTGHTHGGQVWLPILGRPIVPSSYGQKFAYGHVRDNDVDIFITSGIGESVLPIRFMVPPEVAVITLKSDGSSGN